MGMHQPGFDRIMHLAQTVYFRDIEHIVPPSQAEILHRLDILQYNLDEFDVDIIDGEFYWRCCRLSMYRPIERLRQLLIRLEGDAPIEYADDLMTFFRRRLDHSAVVSFVHL